jgi:hypothetical protein
MAKEPGEPLWLTAFSHRVLDRLTSIKIRVGLLRRHLRGGELAPSEAEAQLAAIEEDVEAAASLIEGVRQQVKAMPSA